MISPKKVIRTVEKTKDNRPVITDSDRSVRNTLIPTLPHRIVVRRKLESFLILRTFAEPGLCDDSASISNLSLVRLKNARFNPENMADCEMQNAMPSQVNVTLIFDY